MKRRVKVFERDRREELRKRLSEKQMAVELEPAFFPRYAPSCVPRDTVQKIIDKVREL